MSLTILSQLMTASVRAAKVLTPADRIGSGLVAGVDYPTAFLSQGQFPMPRLPEPEPRSRRAVADDQSLPPNGNSNGPDGRISGNSARHPWVNCVLALGETAAVTRTAPPARTTAVTDKPVAGMPWCQADRSRASHPGSHPCLSSIGRDCQSPDRLSTERDQFASLAMGGDRTASPAAAAGK